MTMFFGTLAKSTALSMKKALVTVLSLLLPVAASAHHAFSKDYAADQIGTIEGEIVEVFYSNPHAHYYVEVDGESGEKELWDVQTMNVMLLSRMGWKKDTYEVGDTVTITGNLGRNNTKRMNILRIENQDGTLMQPVTPAELARVEAAAESSAVAGISSGLYELDQDHAYLTFSYSHLGASFPQLRFTDFSGALDLDSRVIENSSVQIDITASSIDTALADLDEELRGAEYFDVDRYPVISFQSHSYQETSPNSGILTGSLTVKDITQEVMLNVRILAASENPMLRKDTVGFTATGTFLRSQFGMGTHTPGISDELSLNISTEFVKTTFGSSAN